MSERKTINKFRGHDFFELGIAQPKGKNVGPKKPSQKGQDVRLMAPFSLKCLNCQEYIAKNRKFNAKKEVTGKMYLGIRIFRFRIRCPRCLNVITFRTDPKTSDYVTETGAVRNYVSKDNEALKYKDELIEETLERLEREEIQAKVEEERKQQAKLGKQTDPEESAMEQLEKKLEQNEKELKLNLEIELLIRRNRLQQEGDLLELKKQEDDELKKKAQEAFRAKKLGSVGGNQEVNEKKVDMLGGRGIIKVKKKRKVVI